jgi:hypothetical protein
MAHYFKLAQHVTALYTYINPLNAEIYPNCHLLALLEAHPILHISRIKVNLLYAHIEGRA